MKPFEIFLIEDNEGDIELIQEVLEEESTAVRISAVSDGEKALQYLRRDNEYQRAVRPDLILLDLNLPKINGRTLLSEIKSVRDLKPIPIVIFSSSDSEYDILRSYVLGANCYVVKPSSFELFAKTISSIGKFWFDTAALPSRQLASYYQKVENAFPSIEKEVGTNLSNQIFNVLLVEDDPDDASLIQEMLSEETQSVFYVETVCRLQHALERLKQGGLDIVLLDLGLPDSQGYDTFKEVQSKYQNIAIVILTGFYQRPFAMQALRSGAQDYLFKGEINAPLLSRVVRYAVERTRAEEERTQMIVMEHSARENAERALLAHNELLAISTHELRTPLTSLKMLLALALKIVEQKTSSINLSKSLKEILDSSLEQVVRLTKNINDLTDLSIVRVGVMPLQLEELDLVKVIADVAHGLRRQLAEAQAPVILKAKSPVIGIWDKFRIEQVAINLITNAMKYGAGKSIEITITGDAKGAVFTVRDHGIGIAKADQKRIFGRFERTEIAKHQSGGLGLGLYIVQEILDLHGGCIHVESAPGEGSIFTIILPLEAVRERSLKTGA